MVLTLIHQGLGLRPREQRALCGKMWEPRLLPENVGHGFASKIEKK